MVLRPPWSPTPGRCLRAAPQLPPTCWFPLSVSLVEVVPSGSIGSWRLAGWTMALANWERLLSSAVNQVDRAPRARAYWLLVRKFTTFIAVTKQPPPRGIVHYIGRLGDQITLRHPHLIREALKATESEEEKLIPHLPAWIGSPLPGEQMALSDQGAFPAPSLRLSQQQDDLPSSFYCPQLRNRGTIPYKVVPARSYWTWDRDPRRAGWEVERPEDSRFFWTPGAPLGSTRWFRIKKDPLSSHRIWAQWGLQHLAT